MKGGANEMDKIQHFGWSMPICRTENGSLQSREIEKIRQFLFRRGVLIAQCFNSHVVILHPSLVKDVDAAFTNLGLGKMILAGSLPVLHQMIPLSIAESRVLELLTPGPLILVRGDESESDLLPVAIPDCFDLRDICSIYNGTMQVYFVTNNTEIQQLIEVLSGISLQQYGINQLGILEYPSYEGEGINDSATISRVYNPGNVKTIVEGAIDTNLIEKASKAVCLWEMGEWT